MEFHELADIFPMMGADEFKALKADIAEHGLREPITLAEGKIADGRNRYKACVALATEPSHEEWDGVGSLLAFIISKNLHRRHLSESQRAMVAAKLANMRQGARTDLEPRLNLAEVAKDDAAQLLNIGRASVTSAKKVLSEGTPGLAEAVEQGKVTVSLAAQIAKLPRGVQPEFVQTAIEGSPSRVKQGIAKWRREQKLAAATPEQVNEDESIILGDCLLVDWPSQIDLIVADPPFCLSIDGTSGVREGKGEWDEMDYETLHDFNHQWLSLAITSLKEEGSIFVFGTLHNIFSVGHILKKLGCYIVRDIVWNKPFVQRQVNLNSLVPSHELIIWARKGKRHTCYLDEITRDVWDIQPEAKYGHPTEKPESLIRRIIAMASDPGELVVDPFLGSGVTCAMAKGLKRRYWGVEKDEQWWGIATQRTRDTGQF